VDGDDEVGRLFAFAEESPRQDQPTRILLNTPPVSLPIDTMIGPVRVSNCNL
jgi:hypothetical protein